MKENTIKTLSKTDKPLAYETLKKLPTFNNLSLKQQSIIKISLYIQSRNQRVSDSIKKIEYKNTQNHMKNWFCHAAVAYLEGILSENSLQRIPNIPNEFFETTYNKTNSLNDLYKYLNKFKLPVVISIANSPEIDYPNAQVLHSLVILGKLNGQYIVWQKKGFKLPYEITTLDKIYDSYKNSSFWGIRPLQSFQP
ncbi:MAG: hypothetical protein HN981_03545 [Candidatus Pacebacteria bacterium]|jgi:hypothetical protein|nr:hypothetical protein [Candidatus Paceibacterota bacterium]MBT4652235.1 hypothetical protein [Candidatus Paceibacterota bacterium]MBT6756647.1 hypothetical protein [Candidatus Paceibacterota bacterium]MBT6921437.1 hypothetical protein [Candidatus Paceibacterota bacterium]